MNNEEKILAILEKHGELLERMDGRLDTLETDVSGLKTDVSALKTDVSTLKTDVSSLKAGQARLEAGVSGLQVRLDVEFQKQLDQLVDGQDQLHRKVTRVESLAEETKDAVDVIRAAVSEHSREIVTLKQAQ